MLSRAFLVNAFRVVPVRNWPVLVWYIVMVRGWMARLAQAGRPVPGLVVARSGVIYRLESDLPDDYWRTRLHAPAPARMAGAVHACLRDRHGREAAKYAAARAGHCTGLPAGLASPLPVAGAPLRTVAGRAPGRSGSVDPRGRAELPLPQT